MPRTTRSFALNRAVALAASVSMLVPGLAAPAMAQSSEDVLAACTAEFGADAEALANCVVDQAVAAAEGPSEDDLARQLEEAAAAEDAAAAETAEAEAAAAEEAARLAAEAEAAAQAQADAEAQAAADEEAARQAEAAQAEADAAAAQAEADAAAAEQAEADAAQAEADAAAAEQAEAEAAATAQAEADAAQAEADAAAAEQAEADAAQAEADAAATAQAEADAAQVEAEANAAEAEAVETEAAEAEAAPAEEVPTAEAEAEAVPAPEAVEAAPVETQAAEGTDGAETLQTEEDAVAEAPVAEQAPLVETPTESAVADEIAARPEPELSEDEQTAVTQAEAAFGTLLEGGGATAAASAAAASDEPAAEAQVEESVITQDQVRTSDQDFETRAVVTEQEDEDRFDRNDKLLLGALGALAVGAVLVNQNNRSRVVSNSGDRVVVQQDDGSLRVLKDDDVLLRQAGSNVRTERFDDGSTRQTVVREDGSRVVTVRDASLRVLRRELIQTDGQRFLLIDDTADVSPVDVATLPAPIRSTRATATDDPLAAALRQQEQLDRRFSLAQVRNIAEVRALAPAFDVSTVTFASGSAAIAPEQAANLRGLATEVLSSIRANPREVFLVEGHTDAVGDAAFNLALSDRRAESLALALNEYFSVPVENMVVQGYGESFLKVQTQGDEQANRRATVRQITTLLQTAAAN